MKPNARNPFLATVLMVAASSIAHADIFDINGTTAGFGVVDGVTYDWLGTNFWAATPDDTGTAATTSWVAARSAYFVGLGSGTNYTVRLGSSGSTNVTLTNLAINLNAAGTGALAGATGNVTIGNSGDTGLLILNANNSVGALGGGTLTINNGVNLNTRTMNIRGGNIVINGVVSGTGASKIAFGSLWGLTSGTLTLANTANTYAGRANTDFISTGYTLAVTRLANGGSSSSIGTSSANIGLNGGTLRYIGSTGSQSTNLGLHIGSAGASFDASGATSADTISISGAPTYSAVDSARTITLTGANLGDNTMGFAFNNNGTGVNVLNKTGAGRWIVTQANGYTGGTNINGGILSLSGAGTTGASTGAIALGGGQFDLAGLTRTVGAVTITSAYASGNTITGGNLTGTSYAVSNSSGNAVIAASLQGNGTLAKSSAGTLTLTGANTYSGTTTLSAGTTRIGVASVGSVGAITSSAIGTGSLTLGGGSLSSDGGTARTILNPVTFTGNATLGDATNNGKLTFGANLDLGAAARTITLNSDVQLDGSFTNSAASAGLTKAGAGTLTINGTNTSFGSGSGFAITGGTVVAANTAAMGNAGQIVTLSSGGSFGTLDLATDTSANAYVLNFGSVAGAGGTVLVNRATAGAAITHTLGTATLGNAKVNVQAGANVTSGTPTLELTGITLSAGAAGDGATTLNPTTARLLVSGNITRTGNSANSLVLDGTNTQNLISGVISGQQTLTKSNVSIWELSNANTFTGRTLVTGGTLVLTHNLALQSSAFDPSGAGTLDVTAINTPTFGGLTSASNYSLPGNVTGLTLNPNSGTLTYSGNLGGGASGLTLTKTGAGTQILSGTNNYTGLTTVDGGELRITSAGAIGGANVTVTSGQLTLDGGITISGKTITTTGSGTNFIGGLQAVTGTNTWAGDVVLGADQARMGARRNATLVISGSIDDGANTFGAVFRNENTSNTNGGGNANTITELSGVSTYGGSTTLVAGVTRLAGGDNRLPTSTVLQFGLSGANARFDMNGRNQEVAGLAVTSSTNDASRDWNANELTNSSATLSTLTVNTTANQTFGLTTSTFTGSQNYTGIITGNIALVKSGSANLTLTGSNSYTQGTRIDAGTLVLGHATNTLSNTGAVHVNGGTLALGANSDTVGAVTLSSGSITGSGTLTGSGSNYDVRSGSVSAILGGSIGLTKSTAGTVTLTGANSYNGATTVEAGTLALGTGGSIAASTTIDIKGSATLDVSALAGWALASGQTLGGTGTLDAGTGNTVTISSGATLAPGASPGTLLVNGDLSLASGSIFSAEIQTSGGLTADLVNLAGDLDILSGALLDLGVFGTDDTLANGTKFSLFSYSGTWNGGIFNGRADDSSFVLGFNQFLINYNDTSGGVNGGLNSSFLTLTVVPEPRAALLGSLGLLALLRRRRPQAR